MQFTTLIILCSATFAQEKLTEHTLKVAEGTKAAKAELSAFKFLEGAWAGTGSEHSATKCGALRQATV